jgi:hypothetical protein
MRVLMAIIALVALGASPAAAEPTAPVFTVIESNVRVPFSNVTIQGFQVARDNSLILDAGPNRWYRATVWEPCKHDLRWAYNHIALDTRPNGTLDRFSEVIVRGRHCPIQTLDRIERPARGTTGY